MSNKILFVGLPNGQIHHELPAYYLAKSGYEVTYIGTVKELKIETIMGNLSNITVYDMYIKNTQNRITRLFKQAITIWKLRAKFDLIYLYSPHNLYAMFLGTLFCRKTLVYHTQDFLDPNQYVLKTKFEKILMRHTSKNFVNEINRGMFLKTLYKMKNAPIVIPTTLPKDFPFSVFNEEVRTKWLKKSINEINFTIDLKLGLHIGSFSDKRCSQQLIESLKFLPNNFCLAFTSSGKGSDSYEKIKECALKYGVYNRIFIYDYLDDKELMELTAQVDVGFLLYPSNDIGNFYQSPGRLSEYVGAGIKVVASNFPSLEQTLLKYGFGCVCDPYSTREIATTFKSICISQNTKHRDNIKKSFQNNFSYELFFNKLLLEINSTLGVK